MSESIRDRFKAAKLDANKKVTDEVEKTFSYSDSKRGDYHKIEDGKNFFRMMPPHSENEPSMQPKVVYWLDCRVEETDGDGKPTGKFTIKPRPIFDSRIHGSTKKDIIDEYIKFTKNVILNSIQDKDERQRVLSPINGWRDKTGKWNPGILPSQSYVCYATKGDIIPSNIGRLELWENDKKALERLNIAEQNDEPIITDSFSDPDTGLQFIITKGKDEKNKTFTTITKNAFEPPRGARPADYGKHYEEFLQSQKVSDEVLQKLSEMESLTSQFRNVYKRTDFDRALEALQMFDEKHGFNTFENDEFMEIVEEINGYYGAESATSSEPEAPTTDIYDMTREELKAYIKENNLPIKIVSSMSEEIIRELIISMETPEDAPKDNGEIPFPESTDTPSESQESVTSEQGTTTSDLEKNFEAQAKSNPAEVKMTIAEKIALMKKNQSKK